MGGVNGGDKYDDLLNKDVDDLDTGLTSYWASKSLGNKIKKKDHW